MHAAVLVVLDTGGRNIVAFDTLLRALITLCDILNFGDG